MKPIIYSQWDSHAKGLRPSAFIWAPHYFHRQLGPASTIGPGIKDAREKQTDVDTFAVGWETHVHRFHRGGFGGSIYCGGY